MVKDKPYLDNTKAMTDEMYEEILKERFTDVDNKAVKPTIIEQPKKNKDFSGASREFWRSMVDEELLRIYSSGEFNGTYNKSTPSFKNMMDVVLDCVSSVIKSSIDEGDVNYEDLKKYITLLDLTIEMLDTILDSKVDKRRFNLEFIAYLHGSINKYITTNMGGDDE